MSADCKSSPSIEGLEELGAHLESISIGCWPKLMFSVMLLLPMKEEWMLICCMPQKYFQVEEEIDQEEMSGGCSSVQSSLQRADLPRPEVPSTDCILESN